MQTKTGGIGKKGSHHRCLKSSLDCLIAPSLECQSRSWDSVIAVLCHNDGLQFLLCKLRVKLGDVYCYRYASQHAY